MSIACVIRNIFCKTKFDQEVLNIQSALYELGYHIGSSKNHGGGGKNGLDGRKGKLTDAAITLSKQKISQELGVNLGATAEITFEYKELILNLSRLRSIYKLLVDEDTSNDKAVQKNAMNTVVKSNSNFEKILKNNGIFLGDGLDDGEINQIGVMIEKIWGGR
ncbi:MAG TPA: hypothetical protein DIV86_01130 [Alphaproteobacteria bacterium]|nr:hypothetical protein [Alphaproteobacteria bacterium]